MHTVGDWMLAPCPEQEGWKVLGPEGSTYSPEHPTERKWVATAFELPDAALIAAAPDMYHALIAVFPNLGSTANRDVSDMVKAAIDKAQAR